MAGRFVDRRLAFVLALVLGTSTFSAVATPAESTSTFSAVATPAESTSPLFALATPTPSLSSFVALAAPAGKTPPQALLGFQVGEKRRYELGPPDALVGGESAEWGIELHHLDGETPELRAVFDLDYTRSEPFGPLRELRVTRSLWAELTVNEAGFPLKVVVGERVESGEIISEYVYGNGRYDKIIRWPETEVSAQLIIPGHDADDELRGVYAFLTQIADRRFTGGKAFNDSVFANPGLLSLAMPRPLPADDWDEELVFLTPGVPLVRYPTQEWIRMQRSPQVLRSYFDRNKLELRGVEEVEVGGETVLARRFEIQGPFRNGYVDALGRVLLLQHDSGSGMERPQHIRLLRPSEY